MVYSFRFTLVLLDPVLRARVSLSLFGVRTPVRIRDGRDTHHRPYGFTYMRPYRTGTGLAACGRAVTGRGGCRLGAVGVRTVVYEYSV